MDHHHHHHHHHHDTKPFWHSYSFFVLSSLWLTRTPHKVMADQDPPQGHPKPTWSKGLPYCTFIPSSTILDDDTTTTTWTCSLCQRASLRSESACYNHMRHHRDHRAKIVRPGEYDPSAPITEERLTKTEQRKYQKRRHRARKRQAPGDDDYPPVTGKKTGDG